jgi:hypothetical protein
MARWEENANGCDMDVVENNVNIMESIRVDVVVNDAEGNFIETIIADVVINDAGVSLNHADIPIDSENVTSLTLSAMNPVITNLELDSILTEVVSIPTLNSGGFIGDNDAVIPSLELITTPSKAKEESFLTPTKELCTDTTCLCSVCLSPLLLRTKVVQTRCKVIFDYYIYIYIYVYICIHIYVYKDVYIYIYVYKNKSSTDSMQVTF